MATVPGHPGEHHVAGRGPEVADPRGVFICRVIGGHGKQQHDRAEANARLIAAAPEQHEALIDARRMMELCRVSLGQIRNQRWVQLTGAIEAADAAIAKVEGEWRD